MVVGKYWTKQRLYNNNNRKNKNHRIKFKYNKRMYWLMIFFFFFQTESIQTNKQNKNTDSLLTKVNNITTTTT